MVKKRNSKWLRFLFIMRYNINGQLLSRLNKVGITLL